MISQKPTYQELEQRVQELEKAEIERKQAEQALRETEDKYQQVTNQIPGMLFQFILHKDGTYSVPYISEKVFEYSGFRPEQVMVEPSLFFQPIHPDDIVYIQEQIQCSAENLSEFMVEHRLTTPFGEIKWFKVKSSPTLLENGDILWNGIAIDATEQKVAEEQIQKNEEMLATIHQNAPVGMGFVDSERRFHWPNPKLAQITGYSLEELEGLQTRRLYTSEKEFLLVGDQQTRKLAGNGFSEVETKWKRQDGRIINVVLNTKYRHPADPAQGIIETALDITRRTHAENDLKIHLAKLDAIFNSTPNILLLVNNEGRIESINHKGIEFSGRKEEELIGRLGGEVFGCLNSFDGSGCGRNPVCLDCSVRSRVESTLLTGEPHNEEEGKLTVLIEGEKKSLDLLISTKLIGTNSIKQVLVSITDITRIKLVENSLAKTKEQYLLAVKGSQDGIWDWDITENELFLSPRWKEIIGYQDHELPNKFSTFEEHLHPEDKKRVLEHIDRYLNGHPQVFSIEFRLRHKDGSYRWILSRGEALWDKKGYAYRMAGSHTDITERKHNEQYYRTIAEMSDNAPNAITIHDFEGRFLYANRKSYELHGYEKNEFMALTLQDIDVPESEALINERMQIVAEKGEASFTVAHFRKDGSTIPLEIFVKKVEWNNEPAMMSIATDITERKKADAKLRQSEERLKLSEKIGKLGNWEYNISDNTLVWSDQVYNLLERDPESGHPAVDEEALYYSKETFARLRGYSKQAINTGEPIENYEFTANLASGRKPIFIGSMFPIKDTTGRVAKLFGTFQDITERKHAEVELIENSQRLQLATDSGKLAIWDWNVKDNILLWDDRMFELYGISRDSFPSIVDAWISGLHPDDRQRAIDESNAALAGEKEYDTTFRILHPDGTIKHIKASAMVIRDKNGKAIRMIGINSDISERKQAEEALIQSEYKYRYIYDNSLEGMYRTSIDGKSLMANKALADILGYDSADEYLRVMNDSGRQVWFDANERSVYLSLLEKQDLIQGYECQLKRYDGTPVWVSLNAKKVRDEKGNFLYSEGFLTDISKRKLAEEEREKLEAHLQQSQKMEAIGTLAGGIAHDFNNILGAILGYTEMAYEDSLSGSVKPSDLNQVLQAGHRAKDLVKQILAFSRQADSDKIPLRPATLVKESIKLLRSSIPTTIDIRQDVDSENNLILANPTQIYQIIMNLCTNAYHAMEETGGTLSISLGNIALTEQDLANHPPLKPGNFIQLSIKDTGSGIAPEIKKRIFDPYFTTKEVGKGTGMGLSIVHGIVKSYGGFITWHSEIGAGTVFKIYLPALLDQIGLETKETEMTSVGTERILFIDDEEILAKMGQTMLERLGYTVTVEVNSLEALATFKNQPDAFDLVITDQTMPGMTGTELARRIMKIRPGMPIILCTGYSSQVSEEKATSFGIKGFAMKPLIRKDIAVLIRKALDGGPI